MRHVRSLSFDALEARKLLTGTHHAAAHVAPVSTSLPIVHTGPVPAHSPTEVAVPLALSGTLTANNKAAKIVTDGYGDQTTMTPVAGVLSGIGAVRGTWAESADANGNYLGPDTIQLHNSKGSFALGFDATTLGQGEQTPQGMVYNGASLELANGTGAYAKASDSGFVREDTNAKETVIEGLTLVAANPAS